MGGLRTVICVLSGEVAGAPFSSAGTRSVRKDSKPAMATVSIAIRNAVRLVSPAIGIALFDSSDHASDSLICDPYHNRLSGSRSFYHELQVKVYFARLSLRSTAALAPLLANNSS